MSVDMVGRKAKAAADAGVQAYKTPKVTRPQLQLSVSCRLQLLHAIIVMCIIIASSECRLPLLPPALQSFIGRRSRREPYSPSWSLSYLLFLIASSLQCVLPLVVVIAIIAILLVYPAPLPQ